MYKLSKRSHKNLEDVENHLFCVALRAIELTNCDFCVICGLRTVEEQREMVRKGASKTMNSRHLTGHAIDVAAWVNGTVDYTWDYYEQIAEAFKQAGRELNVDIEWGGDWNSFKDGMHFQLSWNKYPI